MHTALTSVTHSLSLVELMGDDVTEATGESPSGNATPIASPVRPPIEAPPVIAGAEVPASTVEVSAMPAMGVANAETATPMHVRLNARVTAAHRLRRGKRATARATDVGMRER